jgi:hypothetical protein
MSKRPTPKKRRAKSKGRHQRGVYEAKQIKRLRNRQQSPYALPVGPRDAEGKALEGITRIKA